ncbi:exonuclease [Saccharata proteae CBS 121410]|uniref:RNA exonuclease 4 n=1 Tax=Saccharata proteae CBS 121410 TaxID=1314787 RepID=A0A9P4HKK1_9PEZI|nr:exonuclease [Saccharata proteae CBS 121410]
MALSSNWKQLQKKLQSEKATDPHANPLKRKTGNEQAQHSNGVKRKRLDFTKPRPSDSQQKRSKMGSMMSTEPPKSAPSATLALFAEDNDIPVADVAAAYNLPTNATTLPQAQDYNDEPNAGLNTSVTAGKYIAIDCEMVGVGPTPDQDSQLARVSIVNFHGHQLYDSYVLPKLPVTDYRTSVSGITPALLRPGFARPFNEVVKAVSDLIQGRILVGHAIQNDLTVLMLSHPKRDIRDTSRHPAFRKISAGKSPSLKRLAKEILGVDIQGGQHSSVEDARATMLLFRREKDAFEVEHAKKWGRSAAGEGEGATNGGSGGGKNQKKKKKKTKR